MTCRWGLTLIELLVALTITGMVMSAGYGALSVLVDRRAPLIAATDAVAEAAAKRRLLVDLLSGARLTVERDARFEGVRGVDANRSDDELAFMTNAPTPLGVPETDVRLYLDRDGDTPERGLMVELRDRKLGGPQRIEIEPNATGLEVRYLSGILGQRAWLDSWVSTTVLPSGVRLTISSEQPDSVAALLRLPLVVRLGTAQ